MDRVALHQAEQDDPAPGRGDPLRVGVVGGVDGLRHLLVIDKHVDEVVIIGVNNRHEAKADLINAIHRGCENSCTLIINYFD